MKVAVFGASGATGRHVVTEAQARGWQVRAIEPQWPDPPEGVEAVTADVLRDDLTEVLAGTDAVISALGLGLSLQSVADPPPLYTEGARRIIRGMRANGIRRLIVISASFVATRDRGPAAFRGTAMIALDRIFDQMADMERILATAEDIDWTAVRPGWLMAGERTDDYVVVPDAIPPDLIRTRHADLAHFMTGLAAGDDWVRATPAIARAEAPEHSSSAAVLRELAG